MKKKQHVNSQAKPLSHPCVHACDFQTPLNYESMNPLLPTTILSRKITNADFWYLPVYNSIPS